MKGIAIALVAPIVIAGCTVFKTSFSTLDMALPKLRGQDIKVAIRYLGIPDRQYPIGDSTVYVWSRSEPNPFQPMSPHLGCSIKMNVENGIVQGGEYDGSNGTCQMYADRLMPLI